MNVEMEVWTKQDKLDTTVRRDWVKKMFFFFILKTQVCCGKFFKFSKWSGYWKEKVLVDFSKA